MCQSSLTNLKTFKCLDKRIEMINNLDERGISELTDKASWCRNKQIRV